MICVLDVPNVKPTPIIQDVGGPSNSNSELNLEDPIMQFVAHNFDQMNAMYKAFTRKLKELSPQPTLTSANPSIIEPLISDSYNVQKRKDKDDVFVESENNDPYNNQTVVETKPLTNAIKKRSKTNNDFYYEPFIFKELDRDVCNLVASPFTERIRDYDMPDGIRVPTCQF